MSLNPSDLVHEAVARVASQDKSDWDDQLQLIAVASLMARRVFMNHIRAKRTHKRNRTRSSVNIEHVTSPRVEVDMGELLALDEALTSLESLSPQQSRIVELKYFGGLGTRDISQILGISTRSVQLGWIHACLWLARELNRE